MTIKANPHDHDVANFNGLPMIILSLYIETLALCCTLKSALAVSLFSLMRVRCEGVRRDFLHLLSHTSLHVRQCFDLYFRVLFTLSIQKTEKATHVN